MTPVTEGKGLVEFDPDALDPMAFKAMALRIQVDSLPAIMDLATLEKAWTYRKLADDLIEKIEGYWKPIKQRERAVWLLSVNDEKAALEGPVALRDTLNKRIADHDTKAKTEQAIAEARAAEEARQQAYLQREREASAAAEGLPAPPPPPLVVVPATVTEVPKVAGLGFDIRYTAVVRDAMALIKAVAAQKVVETAVAPVSSVLDDMARTFGPQTKAKDEPGREFPMPGVPGVMVIATKRPRG
jgi:hypothetical protein